MKRSGIFTIEIIIALVIFTIGYFVVANKLSYNFAGDFETELYNQTISAIETQAAIYAEYTDDFFANDETIYMTVLELAQKNVIISTTEGVVADPRDNTKTLNDLKVKITRGDKKIEAKVLG